MVDVYFRFVGSPDEGVADVSVSVDRASLEAKESLLSKMASAHWNVENLGASSESPILINVLKTFPVWGPVMANVIVCAQCAQPLVLPSSVELEELLQALDHFNIPLEDDGVSVNLSQCSIAEGIRARTFLADNASPALKSTSSQL